MSSSVYSVGDLVRIRVFQRDRALTKTEPLIVIGCTWSFTAEEGSYTLWSASLGKTFYVHGNDLKPYGK